MVASNKLYLIPSPDLYLFGGLSSAMHMAWVNQIAGRYKRAVSSTPARWSITTFRGLKSPLRSNWLRWRLRRKLCWTRVQSFQTPPLPTSTIRWRRRPSSSKPTQNWIVRWTSVTARNPSRTSANALSISLVSTKSSPCLLLLQSRNADEKPLKLGRSREAIGPSKNTQMIASLTLCLAILTLGALIWQTIETRYAVRIANKTLVSTFRPRLILRQVSLCVGTFVPALGAPDEESWKVDYVIANTEGTRAHITSTSFAEKMFSKGGLPVPLPYAPPIAGSTFSRQPGEEKEFSVGLESDLISLFRILGYVRGGNLKHQRTAFVYFLGYVHYKDDLGVVRKMAVLRHYDTESGRFTVVDDPDYEYAD